jgi:adenine-specific DNA-methyltransferase
LSAIHDLISQVSDPRLRDRLAAEWANASRSKKFGLVFEDHLPELLPLHKAKPRRGDLVCRRDGLIKDVWQVQQIRSGMAVCVKPGREAQQTAGHTADRDAPVAASQWAVEELLVVRQFGEPIFPSLVPVDAVANGPADAPWHTLIEADNYHALQLLEYLYAGQVDCIYIDPPYNTGARDWKYNNDYVDGNDGWRHSKWLAFMERRLQLAKRLLRPDNSVLVVTIDEKEYLHLGMLLEKMFPDARMQMVTIVINAPGQTRKQQLARVEEYAYFLFIGSAEPPLVADDLLNDKPSHNPSTVRWESLLRSGTNSRRVDRPALFYPVYIRPESREMVGAGDSKPLGTPRDAWEIPAGATAVWPLKSDGSEGNWRASSEYLRQLAKKGFVRVAEYRPGEGRGTIWYLGKSAIQKIETGEILISGRDSQGAVIVTPNPEAAHGRKTVAKTVWNRSTHHAGWHGTNLVGAVLPGKTFPFPKSLYSVVDTLRLTVGQKPNGLVLDFFAGSGTTLNAVNLLNATDGGRRRCILVTNNEVSADEAAALSARALQPGDAAWESLGICRSVTWPRNKYTILGRRDDGTALSSDYYTGRNVERERGRRFIQVGFVDPATLESSAKKRQLVALIDALPQTLVKEPCPFIVSEEHKASVLFDPSKADDWLEALDGHDHITDFYIVTPLKRLFDQLKAQVIDLLGPLFVSEEERRPMSTGFEANLAYFKLDFLESERVSLRRAFREILPLLWLKAGAAGRRPELKRGEPEPALFVPDGSNFIVLLDETRMSRMLKLVRDREGLSHVFIVTDADESFKNMASEIREIAEKTNPDLQVVQLYRDYLLNFMINHNQHRATTGALVQGDAKGARA